MTVHFIGAGPGAADLITLRGARLLTECPVCLYAGSIVAPELLSHCGPTARLVDTAPLSLDEIEAEYLAAHAAGQDVARLHSGDLSVWSAVAEQIRRLEKHGIPIAMKTLNKLASIGGGPAMQYAGRIPLYRTEDLDAWATERLSKPVRSTAERTAA